MKKAAVVLDSNVWISALVFGGNPRKVLESLIRSETALLISHEIIFEVRRILNAKFPDFRDDFEALLAALSSKIIYISLGTCRIEVCRDEDDNRVLETAVLGRATLIVSGDQYLLVLKEFKDIKTVSPKSALELM